MFMVNLYIVFNINQCFLVVFVFKLYKLMKIYINLVDEKENDYNIFNNLNI